MSIFRRAIAAVRSLSYCPTHDRFYSSDLCGECMKLRLCQLEVVDRSVIKPEWSWPIRRDEDDRLVVERGG